MLLPEESLQGQALNSIVERFEQAWQSGPPPCLEDYLADTVVDRRTLLIELILTDLEYRLKTGQTVRVEEYLERFPELTEVPEGLVELIVAEYSQCLNLGHKVAVEDYLRRFPPWRSQLVGRLGEFEATGPYLPGEPNLPPRLGRYRIEEKINQGGMGIIVRVQDEDFDRPLAMKVMKDRFRGDQELHERFFREARITGQLQHPGIPPVQELGRLPDGQPYLIMKLIKGKSLSELLKEKAREEKHDGTTASAGQPPATDHQPPQDLPRLLNIFEQICQTVAYAHAQRIIHRDLKPLNIMVGEFGEVQVMDWGLAKVLSEPDENGKTPDSASATGQTTDPETGPYPDTNLAQSTPLTNCVIASRGVMGTTSYMAPEQARGEIDQMDERCDVFGLGGILCEILTGQPTFAAGNELANLQLAKKGDLSEAFARLDGCGADEELVDLTKRCLAPDRKARPRHAGAVAEAVATYQADMQERLWQAELERSRATEERKRRRVQLALATVSVMALTTLLAIGLYFNTQLQAEVWRAEQNEADARLQTKKAEDNEAEALKQKKLVEKKAAEALAEKIEAEKQLLRAEWLLYAIKINLAQREWEANNAVAARILLSECRPDFRGWEYHYLYTLFNHHGQRTLKGHVGSVSSVAFSHDGKRIVSGCSGGDFSGPAKPGQVKVWDTESGQEMLTLKGHRNAVTSVAFSPDGKQIVSSSADTTLKVWNAQNGQQVLTFNGHTDAVSSVAYSTDGKRIVSGSFDKTVKVWDVQSGRQVLTLKGHTDWVLSVAYSSDGKRIASSGFGKTVKVWDAESGQELLTLQGHMADVSSVAFSPDSKRIVSSSHDGTIKVWDVQSGQEILLLKEPKGLILSVAYSSDGKRLVSGSYDNTVKIWDAESGQEVLTLKGHTGQVRSVVYSPDGKLIVSGSSDKTVKVWEVQTGQQVCTLKGHSHIVNSVAFSPDSKRIVSGCSATVKLTPGLPSIPGQVKLWDTESGQKILTLKGFSIHSVAFCPDGKRIISADGVTVRIWDAENGLEVHTLKGHSSVVSSVAFSPDGKRLVSASGEAYVKPTNPSRGEVKVWDAESGQVVLSPNGHRKSVLSVAYSPDGKRIVSGSLDKTVKIWDAESGQELLTLKGHLGSVRSVAFSPDGKRIVSGSFDKTVKVWDAESGQELLTLKGHLGSVRSIAFNSDGKRIISGGGDKMVKIWAAESGQELLTLKGHTAEVSSAAFSPDGKWIVTASYDKTVKVWNAQNQ